MGLGDLVGQRVALRLLSNALAYGRIANAYLFAGPAGAGKKWAALAFAKALNCQDVIPGSGAFQDACGRCRHCRLMDARAHPDLTWVIKEGQSIKIEQLQRAREEAWVSPSLGRFRIIVVPDAETMTAEAANCLLKTLEEPPASTVLLLTAPDPAAVMSTIVSRCQVVPFRPASAADIQAFLSARGYGDEVAGRAAICSGGILRVALERAQAQVHQEGAPDDEESLVDEVLALASPVGGESSLLLRKLRALACAEKILQGYSGASEISDVLQRICLRLRTRLAGAAGRRRPERLPTEVYVRAMELLSATSSAIGRNANPRIGVVVAMLRLAGTGWDTPRSEGGDVWLLPSGYVSSP